MKIKYLETAAAEGIPAIFCNCDICKEAKRLKGKDIRTRSQVLIDDDLMVDFPPDSYAHFLNNDFDFSGINKLLITHSHMDHFAPMDLILRGGGFAHDMTCQKLTVVANEISKDLFMNSVEGNIEDGIRKNIDFKIAKEYSAIELDNCIVTPLPARHNPKENCMIYIIEKNGERILYCNDTGILFEDTFEFIKGKYFDVVSFDCTTCKFKSGDYHMRLQDNVIVKDRLMELGCIDDCPTIVYNGNVQMRGRHYGT